MPTAPNLDASSNQLDAVDIATLKIAIRHGLYQPDLGALADALLDDPSILDDRHDHN